MKIVVTLAAAIAALATGSGLAASPSFASYYGDAPWCVITSGGDEARWNCAYRTSQECVQALTSVIRGSCNVNPAGAIGTLDESVQRRPRRR